MRVRASAREELAMDEDLRTKYGDAFVIADEAEKTVKKIKAINRELGNIKSERASLRRRISEAEDEWWKTVQTPNRSQSDL
jgi:hypothetical protein